MKKYALLFILVLFHLNIHAQDEPLVIDKLLYKQSDLTASTQPRLDNNGKACGLIKVVTSDKSMTFEGSIVGDAQYKNGEYWVYVPAGTYQIRIKASSKKPQMLNFKDYNIKQVESKATYELTFYYQNYDKIFMGDPRTGNPKIVYGPSLKKYAVSILTLPAGLTINHITSLEYMKKLAYVIETKGDGWGTKHKCTILSYEYDGELDSYQFIIETMDDEEDAILSAAAGHGGFEEIIYEVIQ